MGIIGGKKRKSAGSQRRTGAGAGRTHVNPSPLLALEPMHQDRASCWVGTLPTKGDKSEGRFAVSRQAHVNPSPLLASLL